MIPNKPIETNLKGITGKNLFLVRDFINCFNRDAVSQLTDGPLFFGEWYNVCRL